MTGIVGHGRDGKPVREAARFVIGAEGHDSLFAKTVAVPMYRECEALGLAEVEHNAPNNRMRAT